MFGCVGGFIRVAEKIIVKMSVGLMTMLKEKLRGYHESGITFARLLAQLDKWEKQYNLSRSDMFELRKEVGI